MPDYEPRTGGVLFPNDRKQNPKEPDFRGNFEITREVLGQLIRRAKENGEIKLSIAAWEKTSKRGNQFMSISGELDTYEPQQQRTQRTQRRPNPVSNPMENSLVDDDDIPF